MHAYIYIYIYIYMRIHVQCFVTTWHSLFDPSVSAKHAVNCSHDKLAPHGTPLPHDRFHLGFQRQRAKTRERCLALLQAAALAEAARMEEEMTKVTAGA